MDTNNPPAGNLVASILRRSVRPAVILGSSAFGFLAGFMIVQSGHLPLFVPMTVGAFGAFVGGVGSHWILDLISPRTRRNPP
jgi:hypothetical protein